MFLYRISIKGTDQIYIGISSNIDKREQSHWDRVRGGYKTKLYDTIRKYNNFEMVVLGTYETREEACAAEVATIKALRDSGAELMNLTAGGDGGFVIQDVEEWKQKLKAARKGRKPSLGMKHNEENKALFKEASQAYWNSQDTYFKDVEEILKLSHKEAKEQFGISTTHYYRLKKRFEVSDLG